MPLFRPDPAPTADPAPLSALPADALRSPEEIADRQRRRRWLVAAPLALLAAVGIGFGSKPALHQAKAWQARRLSADAERFIASKQWLDARIKVQDALQIWQQEPAALRAAALLLGHTGNAKEAAGFWKLVEEKRPLTREEQREYTQSLLGIKDLPAAERHLRKAWPEGEPGGPLEWALGMQLAAARNHRPEAADLSRRLLASKAATLRQRLGAAQVLAMAGDNDGRADAWDTILALSKEGASQESLESLVLLAQRLAPVEGAVPAIPAHGPTPSLSEVIDRIEAHPLAKIQHHLLDLDLRIAQNPSTREAEIQSAIDRFAGVKDDADLGALAAWLYSKGEFGRVLEVIPEARSTADPTLFFHRLDALAALDRWLEIRQAIQSRKVALDPLVEQMYLARCAEQLGEPIVRDARWDAALDAAGASPDKLAQLGAYAQKTGHPAVAIRAFGAAAQASPDSREAYAALLGAYEAAGDTRKMRETVAAICLRWPQDTAALNDAAYLDALLGENLRAALETARQLVAAEPASVPHRVTLALAELRSGHDLAALDAINAIDLAHTALLPRQRAVIAAVFWATSYAKDAREAMRQLPLDSLLPEERALTQPVAADVASPMPSPGPG